MNVIVYLKEVPFFKKLFGVVVGIVGIYVLVTNSNILFGLMALVIGINLVLTEGSEINLENKTYRTVKSIFGINFGKWQPCPKFEYVSVFRTKETQRVNVVTATTAFTNDIIVLNLFYGNKKITFYKPLPYMSHRNLSKFEIIRIVIIFPIIEEIVFRKFLLSYLYNKLSKKKSIVVLSIGFSLCHLFSDSGLVYIFLLSVFYSWIYLNTQNIYLSIFGHILNNGLSVYISPLLFLKIFHQTFFYYAILFLLIFLILYTLFVLNKLIVSHEK